MVKYHLFAHMDKNFVKKGDKVKKYETKIGTIGKGNGNNYFAHLHFSISTGLTVPELYNYVIGWSKEKIKQHYINPVELVDFSEMFKRKMDVGKMGYGFLDEIKAKTKSFHPGLDINGLGGGDTDFGFEFTSSCNGEVIYAVATDEKNGGWGNLVIVEEENLENVSLSFILNSFYKKRDNGSINLENFENNLLYILDSWVFYGRDNEEFDFSDQNEEFKKYLTDLIFNK